MNLCQGFRDLGRWERARQAGEEAVRLARERQSPVFLATALGNLGDVAFWRGEYPACRAGGGEAEAIAREDLAAS